MSAIRGWPQLVPGLAAFVGGAEHDRRIVAILIGLSLGLTATGLALPVFAQHFVDGFGTAAPAILLILALAMLATGIVRAGLVRAIRRLALERQLKAAEQAGEGLIRVVLAAAPDALGRQDAGEIAAIVRSNDRIARHLYAEIMPAALALPTVPLLLTAMAWYSPLLALVALLLACVNAVVLAVIDRQRARLSHAVALAGGRLAGLLTRWLTLIPTIRAGALEPAVRASWVAAQTRRTRRVERLGRTTERLAIVPGLVAGLANAAFLAIGAGRIMDGSLSLGALVACQTLLFAAGDPIRRWIDVSGSLQEIAADLRRRERLATLPPDRWLATHAAGITPPVGHQAASVTLAGLAGGPAAAAGGPRFALADRHFPAGAAVAVMGGSGSGKTALCRLLCGLDEPWSGEVLIDRVPVRAFDRATLAATVALVDRKLLQFAGTVRDTLTLWRDDADPAALWEVLRAVDLDRVIAARPGGLDAELAQEGRNLSGGQQQRLELARALLRRPRVLILDEALEALDPTMACRILERLRQRDLTLFVVSRRAQIVGRCDEQIDLGSRTAEGPRLAIA